MLEIMQPDLALADPWDIMENPLDPVIQLASLEDMSVSQDKDSNHSTTVDEEIILENGDNVEVNSNQVESSSKVVLNPSENSGSSMLSAPPGFSIKGKCSVHDLALQDNEVSCGIQEVAPWISFFTAKSADSTQVKIPIEWTYFIARQLLSPD